MKAVTIEPWTLVFSMKMDKVVINARIAS